MSTPSNDRSNAWLHRVSVALCVLTYGLIVWGGHVNTTRSGMAFPDWPTSNSVSMVTYRPSEWLWQQDRFWEHGHRLFATVVGMVTVGLVLLTFRTTPRDQRSGSTIIALDAIVVLIVATAIVGLQRMPTGIMESVMIGLAALLLTSLFRALRATSRARVFWLAQAAFFGVCLQGSFGGYTVRNNLPDWTSTTHGMLAEMFFMIAIGLAMSTSHAWTSITSAIEVKGGRAARNVVVTTWVLTIVQFLLGALTRHTDSWGVSVTWPEWGPTSFLPTTADMAHLQVVIHFLHRTMAYGVAVAVIAQWILIMRQRSQFKRLVVPTAIASVLVIWQILLGVMILFTFRSEGYTTAHVATGVLLVAVNTMIMYTMQHYYRPAPVHGRLAYE